MNKLTTRFFFLSAALLLPACQQEGVPTTTTEAPFIITDMSFSRPVGAAPGGTLRAPEGERRQALLSRVPDSYFAAWEEDEELSALLQRLELLAEEVPDSAARTARELAKVNPLRGQGPGQFYSDEEALAQEEQYLALGRQQRVSLATQAMKALLESPRRADDILPEFRLHSFDALDVEALRGAVGGYMGRTLMAEEDYRHRSSSAQRLSRGNSERAYKRLMARIMLEEVAADRALPKGTRCAALRCLQHIGTEQKIHDDGARELAYLSSALPARGAVPALLCMGEMRFCHYDRRELFAAAERVEAFMAGSPRASQQTAQALAGESRLAASPVAGITRQDMLRAEQQYKALSRAQRVALAREVLADHLTQPLTPCHSAQGGRTLPLRSFDGLNVEAARRKAGGIFAGEHPQAARLFKRMVVRTLLEENLAEHPVYESCVRHAALESLQHICREAMSQPAGGDVPLCYMTDALPALENGLEQALFGGKAWPEPAAVE